MRPAAMPPDAAGALDQLAAVGYQLVMVKRMPTGMRWRIHGRTLYMRCCPAGCVTTQALRDALGAIAADITPHRPRLVSLLGGAGRQG